MRATLADNALMDRGDGGQCNMPRIPTGRYPAFSTTLEGTADANGNVSLSLEAERDYLFIGMSVDSDSGPNDLFVDLTYCNTKYLVHSSGRTWVKCCDRKPIFLVGVAENKRLEFQVSGATPSDRVIVTLHGFQGSGCCG